MTQITRITQLHEVPAESYTENRAMINGLCEFVKKDITASSPEIEAILQQSYVLGVLKSQFALCLAELRFYKDRHKLLIGGLETEVRK